MKLYNPYTTGAGLFYEYVRWNGSSDKYFGTTTDNLATGTIYRVLRVEVGNDVTLCELQDTKTGKILENTVNTAVLVPVKCYTGITASYPRIGERHKVNRVEIDKDGSPVLAGCTTSKIEGVLALSKDVYATITRNSVYILTVIS